MSLHFKPSNELKSILGAYAAMARHNAYVTIMDIMAQLHLEQPELPNENHPGEFLEKEANLHLLRLFPQNGSLPPEIEERAMRLTCSHFPFLNTEEDLKKAALSGEKQEGDNAEETEWVPVSYAQKCSTLIAALKTLSFIRDKNLHYLFNDNRVSEYDFRWAEQRTGFLLRRVLKAAPRLISDRYKGTGLLRSDCLDFFRNDEYKKDSETKKFKFNLDWDFSPQRLPSHNEWNVYRIEKRQEDRDGSITTVKQKFLVTDKNGAPATFLRLTQFGIIVLVSLFIDKRYLPKFLKECGLLDLNGFPEHNDDGTLAQQRLLREVIAAYSIRIPKRRLDIELDSTQVSLDILNELMKCPAELYDILPEDEQRKFEVVSSDGTPVLLKRHSDRFPQLLLKYIDTTECFESIRFHINTGKFRYILHDEKPYMDGIPRQRIVQSGVNGFERLQEAERLRTAQDTYLGFPIYRPEEEDKEVVFPYVTDSRARYLFNGNIIGLSTRGNQSPVIEKTTDERGVRYRVRTPQPDCWISRYELPGMALHLYLSRRYNTNKSTEDVIKEKVEQYRQFFDGVAKGTIKELKDARIPEKEIPEKLLVFLKNEAPREDFQKYKASTINSLIEKTNKRISCFNDRMGMIGKKDNRVGKKSYVRVLPGRLASFLADDIVFFQDYPEGKPEMRLTGQQFSVLQGLMATFPPDTRQFCEDVGLLVGETAHPFLKRVFDAIPAERLNTINFYETYLQKRLAYLSGQIPDNARFLHSGKTKWSTNKDEDYYRALAKRYLDAEPGKQGPGILLPRGLFFEPIKDILRSYCPRTYQAFEKEIKESGREGSVSQLIALYLVVGRFDDVPYYYLLQPVGYAFDRIVKNQMVGGMEERWLLQRAMDDFSKDKGEYKGGKTRFYTCLKEAVGSFCATKPPFKIRHLETKKEELKEKLRHAYLSMQENEKALRRLQAEDAVLFLLASNAVAPDGVMKLKDFGSDSDGFMDQTTTVTTTYKQRYRIQQRDITIRDHGLIYKVLLDKRIDSLLEQIDVSDEDVIQLSDIITELEKYDDDRVPIVRLVQQYEKSVVESNQNSFNSPGKRIGFKDVQKADTSTSPVKKKAIRMVRNSFSHNSYPAKTVTENGSSLLLHQSQLPEIADGIKERIGQIINPPEEE